MVHACSCGWVGWCAENGTCGVKDLETLSVRGVDVLVHHGRLVGVGVGLRMGLLKKVFPDQVR